MSATPAYDEFEPVALCLPFGEVRSSPNGCRCRRRRRNVANELPVTRTYDSNAAALVSLSADGHRLIVRHHLQRAETHRLERLPARPAALRAHATRQRRSADNHHHS